MFNFIITAIKGFTKSAAKDVAKEQFVKTAAGKAASKVIYRTAQKGVSTACKTQIGKTIVAKTGSGIAKKAVHGAASRTVVSSAMKGNVLAAGASLAIDSAGDVYDYCRGKQSGKQFRKNMGKNVAHTGSSMVFAGIGGFIGSLICPGPGTAAGSAIGGILGSLIV